MRNKTGCSVYNRDALIQEIEKHDIISFDIFDSLVMRKVYYNKDVFRKMALQLDSVWGIDFYTARTEAEATLSKETYPYIEEIYDDVSRRCPCLKGQESDLIQAEIALEQELIIPRKDVVAIFDLAKQSGKMVNIVSDMYFHQETIRTILDNLGINGYQKLLISSEYHTSKPKHLFEKYLTDIPTGRYLHIGDSWECDILPAGKLGIDTFRLKMSSEIYEYEENTIPPSDLQQRTLVAEYVAQKYNSPFFEK